MANQLTNDYDGLWEGSFHNAGTWELSLGRWFWLYISRLRFGTSPDPFTSLLTLALMAVGLLFLFDLWQIKNKYLIIVSGLLFLSNPAICFELSYRFMSPTFGVAFLLSILGVWCFEKIKSPIASVLAGAACISFSMGAYQAYICCTTVAFLTALLMKLSKNVNWRGLLLFCAKSITGIFVGGIGYTVILQFHLWVCGVKMSGYQGGSSYSILNSICSLPASLYKMYQLFWLYFKGVLFRINRMQGKQIFTLMFILASVLAVICFVRIFKKSRLRAIIFGALILLYPAAALSVLMIATNAEFALQMACGPALFLAALPCLFYGENDLKGETDEEGSRDFRRKWNRISQKSRWFLDRGFFLLMTVILYGSIYQVVIDQNIMYEGKVATENITDMIVDQLLQEDLVSDEYRYVFVGTPVSSMQYFVDTNYSYANHYALYGAWYLGNNSAKSWKGVIRNIKGMNLNMVTGPEYDALSVSKMVESMPQFPKPGSILLDNDIVYVKVGNAN